MVCDTLPSQDASTHQIWNSYLKEYRRYAPDTKRDGRTDIVITIKSKSEVKVTVTQKIVRDTLPSQDPSTHQIWNSYLKEYRRYALDLKRDGQMDASQSSFGGIKTLDRRGHERIQFKPLSSRQMLSKGSV